MRCAICGIEIDFIDEAIEHGWIPCFYEEETEHEFACPGCAEIFLELGEDGEMEVKEEYCGKVQYMNGAYACKPKKEDLVIEIFMMEESKGERH